VCPCQSPTPLALCREAAKNQTGQLGRKSDARVERGTIVEPPAAPGAWERAYLLQQGLLCLALHLAAGGPSLGLALQASLPTDGSHRHNNCWRP